MKIIEKNEGLLCIEDLAVGRVFRFGESCAKESGLYMVCEMTKDCKYVAHLETGKMSPCPSIRLVRAVRGSFVEE